MRTPLARDPEKWEPVFGKDHAQNKNLERDDESKKNHPALALLLSPLAAGGERAKPAFAFASIAASAASRASFVELTRFLRRTGSHFAGKRYISGV
jgi:hypothetical protein